jgi:hypothetical protein
MLWQCKVPMHCGAGQLPQGRLPKDAPPRVNLLDLVNKNWREITWLHHLDKLSRLNAARNPTCLWYDAFSF